MNEKELLDDIPINRLASLRENITKELNDDEGMKLFSNSRFIVIFLGTNREINISKVDSKEDFYMEYHRFVYLCKFDKKLSTPEEIDEILDVKHNCDRFSKRLLRIILNWYDKSGHILMDNYWKESE